MSQSLDHRDGQRDAPGGRFCYVWPGYRPPQRKVGNSLYPRRTAWIVADTSHLLRASQTGRPHSPTVRAASTTLRPASLEVWTEPGKIGLVGEVDASNVEQLTPTLSSAKPVAGELFVDLAGLSFIDVGGT